MKIINRYPVISAIAINLLTLFGLIYLYNNNYDAYLTYISMILLGGLNHRILKKADSINNKERAIVISTIILVVLVFLFYVYNSLINKYM